MQEWELLAPNESQQSLLIKSETSDASTQKETTSWEGSLSPPKAGVRFGETKAIPGPDEGAGKDGKKVLWRDIYAEIIPKKSIMPPLFGKPKKSKTKVILDQVSGYADPCQVTFIMGASGAGKTTLLNILTQKRNRGLRIFGDIAINDTLVDAGDMKKVSAFVQQDDLFTSQVTVEEQLMFAARLRMPAGNTDEQHRATVEDVIQEMGLNTCRKNKIGSTTTKCLSRSERKRLAFATEILTDPWILYCDEPTSGLDSFMSSQVVAALKRLAARGKTVISTIHQPSSPVYELADRLILMANCQVVYQGSAAEVGEFFSSCGHPCPRFVSQPDHFMKVVSRDERETEQEYNNRVENILEAFESSDEGKAVHRITHTFAVTSPMRQVKFNTGNNSRYAASWFTQTWWLFFRSLKSLLRNPTVLYVRTLQVITMSLIIGSIYFQTVFSKDAVLNYKGAAIRAVCDMVFIFLFPCIYVFTEEMPVVIREYQSHTYMPSAYYVGLNAADTLQYLIFPTVYSAIVYLMAGYSRTLPQYILFNFLNVIVANVATSVAYAAACICGNLTVATTYVPVIVNPLLSIAGFFIDLRSIPIYFRIFTHVSWFKYSYEDHLIILLHPIESIPGCPSNSTHDAQICSASDGDQLLTSLGFNANLFWVNIGILLGMILFIRLIGLIAFSIRIRRS